MPKKFNDGKFVAAWYQERVNQYGLDIRSLGYNQKVSQCKRFEELLKVGDLKDKRVLDVGCGLGDFLDYLIERNIPVNYTGIDLVPEMIRQCQFRFRDRIGRDATFEASDTLEYSPTEPFDFVVASGIFGLLSEHGQERIEPTLERLFSWARSGIAINFLSARSTRKAEGRLYVDPATILKIGLQITPSVELSHSYLPNDFTLFMYRSPTWEKGEDSHAGSRNGNTSGKTEPVAA